MSTNSNLSKGLGKASAEAKKPEVETQQAEVAAAEQGKLTPALNEVVYTSHPILNFRVGKYHFEKGTLTLKGDEVEKFEKLRKSLPESEARHIARLDVSKVNALAAGLMPSATQQFDSSVGRSNLEALRAKNPAVGTVPVERANRAQQDGNEELDARTGEPLRGE